MKKKRFISENVYDEGGLGGHMGYAYEFPELKFTDIFELIDDLFDARVEHVTEKLDGQNIFVTVTQDGQIRFARNGSDAINVGFDRAGIGAKWDKPEQAAIKGVFSNAYDTFSDYLKGIDPKIFRMDNAQIWMNCEIINPASTNVIPYGDNKKVSVHALVAFQDGTKNEVDIPDYDRRMDILKRHLEGGSSQYGGAQITPEIALRVVQDSKMLAEKFKKELNEVIILADNGYPSLTIDQWKKIRQKSIMLKSGYGELFNLGEFSGVIEKRLIDDYKKEECHSNNIKKWLKANMPERFNEIVSLLANYEKNDEKKIIKEVMMPLEDFFVRLGTTVIENVSGYENEGIKSEVVNKLASDLEMKIEEIRSGYGEGTPELVKMTTQLKKLERAEKKLNAMEGIVFNWRGRTMKLTGCFAPLNQIMGIGRFNR